MAQDFPLKLVKCLFFWPKEPCRGELSFSWGCEGPGTEALARFFDRLNDSEPAVIPVSRNQVALERQAAEAEAVLRQRGLIK